MHVACVCVCVHLLRNIYIYICFLHDGCHALVTEIYIYIYRCAGTSPHEDPATISVDSFDNNVIQLLYANRNGEIQRYNVFANKIQFYA